MARARNLKPGFFSNEDLAECSFPARLCFAGLWTLADREGRLEDRPKRIKGELFRYDSIEVEPLLMELAEHGFIERYAVEGRGIVQILAFSKHQNPHHREPESDLPPPPSPGLRVVSNPPKPEASPGLDPPLDDMASGVSQGTDDLEGGSSRAESLFSDSGFRIPDSVPPPAKPGALSVADLRAEGIDGQHASDWLVARKAKRLPLTRTAWNRFKADAAKQGLSPPKAVERCAGKGWAGLYADDDAVETGPMVGAL